MKPSLKAFKDKVHEAREEVKRQTSDVSMPLGAAYAWKKDKALQKWFNANCRGKDVSHLEEILAEGRTKGEITEKQVGIIRTVVGFAVPTEER